MKLSRKQGMIAAATGMSLMGIQSAHAVLTAEATSALASITTAVTDMEAGVWPILGAVVVALISIKLFKRFSNKV